MNQRIKEKILENYNKGIYGDENSRLDVKRILDDIDEMERIFIPNP